MIILTQVEHDKQELTIKIVLDSFATAGEFDVLEFKRNSTWSFKSFKTIRVKHPKLGNICPLQNVCNSKAYYIKQARLLGLDDYSIDAIIEWADSGRWPIPKRYYELNH